MLTAKKIKLGEPGWRERYYEEKFYARTPEQIEAMRKDVVLKYTEGLCWVMHYYYEGVCSWQWFYPYHYAPFASDLKDLGELDIKFKLGSPFKPFSQLLGVFPAASSHALPEQYRKLMTDPSSPIIDFYPTDFEVDMNGKRFSWQGIAKLPFIDEARLLAEVEMIEHTLTEEEAWRNRTMLDMLFVALSHPISSEIFSLDDRCKHLTEHERTKVREQLDPVASGGMNGYISLCNGDPCPPVFRSPVEGMEDIMDNQVICAVYLLPDVHNHVTRPPPGVVFPKKIVTIADIKAPPALWHEDFGRKSWENRRQNNYGNNHGRQFADGAHRPAEVPRHSRKFGEVAPSLVINPPGVVSGKRLNEAAHRLVVNSLNYRQGRGYSGNLMLVEPPYTAPSHGQHTAAYQNARNQGLVGAVPPAMDYPPPGLLESPNAMISANDHHRFDQQSDPPPSCGYYPYHRYNTRAKAYIRKAFRRDSGSRYPARPIEQYPAPGRHRLQAHDHWSQLHPQQPSGGYGHPQQGHNPYSPLERSRQPPFNYGRP